MLKYRLWAIGLFLIGFLATWFVYSSEINPDSDLKFKLGLDLSSGTHLTYLADVSEISPIEIDDAMNSLRQTIERRVNIFGVSEPIVQVEKGGVFSGEGNENRLIVELPGVTDVTEAIKQIGQTPILEFRLENPDFDLNSFYLEKLSSTSTEEEILAEIKNQYSATGLTGAQLDRASLIFDPVSGQPTVGVNFNSEGTELLSKITEENIGNVMAIFLDGQILSNPVIQAHITNGQAVITGQFNPEEARDLVRNLNFGALPVPIELIETQTIGPTLGAETLQKGAIALLIGFILISLFLIIFYRLPGIFASISLIFYVSIMFALFKLIPVTLTASGLAGFILSIGMAVDANILIFERMKEELKKGSNTYDAVSEGVKRAWTSIRDGNLTSIISAVVLFWLSGTSLVKGFALVFGLGVLVSMFTAIVISKMFLLALSSKTKKPILEKFFGNKIFNKN